MARRLVLLAVLPLALVLGLSIVLIGGDDCPPEGTSNPGTLSPEAEKAIPPDVAEIYVAMARRWNIDVAFLAAIGAQETDHGRNPTTNEVNGSGCQGLMQLGVGGACGDYWGRNKCDGNDDGRMLDHRLLGQHLRRRARPAARQGRAARRRLGGRLPPGRLQLLRRLRRRLGQLRRRDHGPREALRLRRRHRHRPCRPAGRRATRSAPDAAAWRSRPATASSSSTRAPIAPAPTSRPSSSGSSAAWRSSSPARRSSPPGPTTARPPRAATRPTTGRATAPTSAQSATASPPSGGGYGDAIARGRIPRRRREAGDRASQNARDGGALHDRPRGPSHPDHLEDAPPAATTTTTSTSACNRSPDRR